MTFGFHNNGLDSSSGSEEINNEDITVTSNGVYTAGAGYTGLGTVDVNVEDIPAITEELNVTPTTSAQTIRPTQGLDGFNPVNVSAVTSAIDQNIVAGNIKSGVSILGTTGNYAGEVQDLTDEIIAGDTVDTTDLADVEADIAALIPYSETEALTITPTTSQQVITAPDDVGGYTPITVNAVTSAIDSNITAGNIKSGVTILGTTGNVVELNATTLTATPTTSQQTFTPTSPNNGYNQVTVDAVTSAIDSNITAGNIKNGVSILGVNGSVIELNGETQNVAITSTAGNTFTPTNDKNGITSITVTPTNEARTVTPTTSQQTLTVNSGYSGNGTITVNAVTSAIDANIQAGNIKKDVVILGTTGTYEGVTSDIISCIDNNYIVKTNGDIELITNNSYGSYTLGATDTTITDMSAMQDAYNQNTNILKLNMNSIVSLNSMMILTYICNQATALKSATFKNLKTISGMANFQYAFFGCTNLVNVDFSSLETIDDSTFSYAFAGCTSLQILSFPSLKSNGAKNSNAWSNMLQGVTGCTVHFPSNLQSVMSSWSSVTNGFGGTNTTVLFDLTATT